MQKELVKVEYEAGLATYTVAFEDGRDALLTVREDTDPIRVCKASVTPRAPVKSMSETIREASTFLFSRIRQP
jgi:hypothetical protein